MINMIVIISHHIVHTIVGPWFILWTNPRPAMDGGESCYGQRPVLLWTDFSRPGILFFVGYAGWFFPISCKGRRTKSRSAMRGWGSVRSGSSMTMLS